MNEDKNNIAKMIKEIRVKRGETMKEFGLNFDPSASDSIVSRWERAISVPNNERLKKIADLGNIPINELLYGEYRSKVYEVFRSVEKEVKSGYPLLSSEGRFRNFFNNIDEFREHTYQDINKMQMFHEDDIRSFYYYRLGRSLPFDDSPKEFSIKVNILRTAGFYSESSIPPKERVTNVIYDYVYRDKNIDSSAINKSALEDTANTFSDLPVEVDDREIIFVYAQNEQFYNNTSDIHVKDKQSYIEYLKYSYSQLNDLYKQNPKLENYFEKNLNYYSHLIDMLKD